MRSAEDMQQLFERQEKLGLVKTYQKSGVYLAVQTQTPCEVVTQIDGTEETRVHAKPGDWILTGPAGERYVLDDSKFHARYRLRENSSYAEAIGSCRATSLDEAFTFMAPWGTPMIFEPGDYLACGGAPSDLYRIERSVFEKTYRCVG